MDFYENRGLAYILLISVFLCAADSLAQSVPNTQLYLFDYDLSPEGTFILSDPVWFSSFNPDGYNNQPYYANGWWYFSARLADSFQNDIYAGHMDSGQLRQITATRDSEYSPTPIGPNELSVVRVEQDSSQRLWSYHLGDNWKRKVLFPNIGNVGYHKWADDSTAYMFLVSDPVSLQKASLAGGLPRFLTSRIGRCMFLDPNGTLYFTQRMSSSNPWQLKSWVPGDSRPRSIVPCPPEGVDFVLLDRGYLLMSSQQKFFLLNLKNRDAGWREVMDFSIYGWPKVTRMAINDEGEMMVVVNYSD